MIMNTETGQDAAHHHPWKVGDIVLFPLLALGLLLEWLFPTVVPIWRPLELAVGAILFVAGFALIRASRRHMDQADQPVLPDKSTTRLLTTGPFGLSRNPIFLGSIIAVSGGVLLFDSWWIAGTTLASAVLLDLWMIRPEERYLRRVFGPEYEAYEKSTRRWF